MGPTAVESRSGYLLSGPVQPAATQSTTTNVFMVTTPSNSEFDLERFWNLEFVGVSPAEDSTDNHTLEHYLTSSVTRDDDGAYIARFPWKPHCHRGQTKICLILTGAHARVQSFYIMHIHT